MKKRLLTLLCALALILSAVSPAAALEGESEQAAKALSSLGLIDSLPS